VQVILGIALFSTPAYFIVYILLTDGHLTRQLKNDRSVTNWIYLGSFLSGCWLVMFSFMVEYMSLVQKYLLVPYAMQTSVAICMHIFIVYNHRKDFQDPRKFQ